MKKLKKLLAVVMMIALMIPVTAFAAEGDSVQKVDLSGAKVTVSTKPVYTPNKVVKPTVKVTLAGATLKEGTDYVLFVSAKNAGSHQLAIIGKNKYCGYKEATYTIQKAAQTVVVSGTKSFKVADLNKKSQSFSLSVKGVKERAKVSFKSSSKNVTVSSTGKVTVKKGTKAGSYKVTVKIAATEDYKATSKDITVKVSK